MVDLLLKIEVGSLKESGMVKSDLVEQLAKSKGIPEYISRHVIENLFDYMSQELIDGNRIEIRGFGSFEIREYKGYTGRNPKTGEAASIQPKKLPFFKVGKELKEKMLSSGA